MFETTVIDYDPEMAAETKARSQKSIAQFLTLVPGSSLSEKEALVFVPTGDGRPRRRVQVKRAKIFVNQIRPWKGQVVVVHVPPSDADDDDSEEIWANEPESESDNDDEKETNEQRVDPRHEGGQWYVLPVAWQIRWAAEHPFQGQHGLSSLENFRLNTLQLTRFTDLLVTERELPARVSLSAADARAAWKSGVISVLDRARRQAANDLSEALLRAAEGL